MTRSPYLAGVAILVTLLLSSALGTIWVDVDGGVKPSAAEATVPVPVPLTGVVSSSGALTPPSPPPPSPEFQPLPLDYVYLDPALYGINVYPWYAYYSGFREQHLYLASEIGRGGTIDQIALFKTYAYTYAGTFPSTSVKMCNTTVTSLTSTFNNNYGGATPVWVYHNDAHVTTSQTYSWDTVALMTPFDYNGSDNLLVEVVWQGSASGYYSYVWYNTASGNRRAGAYNITDTLVSGANYTDNSFYNTRIGFRSVANDVGASKIVAPQGLFCTCDTLRPVTVQVKNWGTANQTNLPVHCRMWDSLDGTCIYNDSTYIDVDAGATVNATFTLSPGQISPRLYNTKIYDTCWTDLATDVRRYNDTVKGFVTVNEQADVAMEYGDYESGANGCYTWTTPNFTCATRFPGPCPVSKYAIALSGYSTDPGGPYPCTVKVRLNDGTDGMPGTAVYTEPMQLYSAGYPNDYTNYIVLDPPAVVTSDSFFLTWKPQVVANPFPTFDWDDPPYQVGNDFSTDPGSEVFHPFVIGPETDANGDLGHGAFYSGYLHDVAVGSIDVPPPVIDSGESFTPEVTFTNAGLKSRPSSAIEFWITDTSGARVTEATGTVPGMNPGESYAMTFPPELLLLPTDYMDSATILCSAHDANPENDVMEQALFVRYYDVMTQIARPMAYEVPGLVPVSVRLTNKGNVPAVVESVYVMISDGYNSHSENVPLAPGESRLVFMPVPWVCPAGGSFTCNAWITCTPDMYHPSDTAMVIIKSGIPGWAEMTPLPAPPTGKPIKYGGCMAYDAGTAQIFASKGNKTGDFYAYEPEAGTWANKTGIPLGAEGKQAYKGSVICSDGNGKLYLTKGNNTVGFWGYDATTNAWTQLTNVPYGGSGKKVKQGAGLAWASSARFGHECVYLLKGYRNEFMRYDPETNTWHTLIDAPIGNSRHVKWNDGSWLVADADAGNMLYAFKSKYHEFYAFDTDADTWGPALTPMPIPGSAGNKKAKSGSCAAWYNGKIYAFKGGNTVEFWRYWPLGDSWQKQDDIPLWGMTGSRKKVKAGAAMAGFPGMGIFAFKGNKTLDFWHYTPYNVVAGAQPSRDGITAVSTEIGAPSFAIAPNPLAGGFATVRYSLPRAGLATLNVFDVTGRTVLTQTMAAGRTGTASLDLRKLEAGVYLVKVTTEGFSTTQKLVVEH